MGKPNKQTAQYWITKLGYETYPTNLMIDAYAYRHSIPTDVAFNHLWEFWDQYEHSMAKAEEMVQIWFIVKMKYIPPEEIEGLLNHFYDKSRK